MSVVQDLYAEPVEGDIIETSAAKALGALATSVLTIPLGAGLAWIGFIGELAAGPMGFKLGLLGAFAVPVGFAGVPVSVLALLRRCRLILGEDRLQLVTKQGRVLTQIPYRNIDRVELVLAPPKVKCVGINLKDLGDSETLNAGSEEAKRQTGWHYRITKSNWLLPLQQIHERLQRRLERARAKGWARGGHA